MTKSLVVLFCVLASSFNLAAAKSEKPAGHPLLKSESVTWAGLDYSRVRMYGTQDFKAPEEIIPAMFDAWNALFLEELILHPSQRLEKAVGKTVKTEIEGVAARNKLAKTDQVIRQDGPFSGETHLKDSDLADAVKSYKLTATSGLGLVFIVDRLVKVENKGALYQVYFDVATREIVAKQRVVVRAAGFGFRNFWFRVPKDSLANLKKLL